VTEEAFAAEAPPRTRTRVRAGLRKPANWFELVRFATVGASGYVVNLAVFAALVHGAGVDYRVAATGAFLVALTNNFAWNRIWTFRARDGHAGFQAARFFVVSAAAFAFNLVVLYALVEGLSAPEVPAQAVAIAAATPLNFLGNKLWSFRA
jgi:dolichol-phosphate mannosyltransferase